MKYWLMKSERNGWSIDQQKINEKIFMFADVIPANKDIRSLLTNLLSDKD